MMKRIHWFSGGAVAAVILFFTGGLMMKSDRNHQEKLIRENERLTQEHEALRRTADRLHREKQQLADVVERLSIERRVAEVDVIQQHFDENGRVLQTVIRLTEIDRDGNPLPSQTFGVPGRMPHFDALVIKFKDDYVAQGDALRGKSVALFRRVYCETQAPEDGFWLGRRGDVPDVYRTNPDPTPFELNLWERFWSFAASPHSAALAGVRVAQGEAVYAPMKPGENWLLTLEADGGLNLIKRRGTTALPGSSDDTPHATQSVALGARLHAPSPLKQPDSVQ